jgi:hypothetical protein
MQSNLHQLLHKIDGLDDLMKPFQTEEMDNVIKFMPADRAPGPDGFIALFLKKCWHLIKDYFYQLAYDFYNNKLILECINASYITLIPKKAAPEDVNEFRPISLTNACLKFLTKLLANRLQDHILRCVHKNQYGFLRPRAIQDCITWAYEYIFQCQQSRKPILIINLDFANAIDTIEHEAIFRIMEHKGFNKQWIGWMKSLMSSGTSSILLNGVLGKQFHCKRGAHRGDPLSPILYVLGGDLLQDAINDYVQQGKLKLPILTNDPDFPVV